MFTFFVQLWLIVIITGILALILQATYVTLRDGRRNRRLLAAHFYAKLVVSDRVLNGELDPNSPADLETAYQFEKIAYLNS